jgi:hypothetical protein
MFNSVRKVVMVPKEKLASKGEKFSEIRKRLGTKGGKIVIR